MPRGGSEKGRKMAKYWACDFETSVYEGQKKTEVWSACILEIGNERATPTILGSIEGFFDFIFKELKFKRNMLYFHNLAFDGSFILSYLLRSGFKQAFDITSETEKRAKKERMPNHSFNYVISDLGSWYVIYIKENNKVYEIRDSLKLLPFTLKQIGEGFGTKHRKLEMEYIGERHPNCEIIPEEKAYIENDVYVLAEGLQIMFDMGLNKLTIGSCCMAQYKKINQINNEKWKELFPVLSEIPLDHRIYRYHNADEYIRATYRGGWCYCRFDNHYTTNEGCTADVNSLYPSTMHSCSGSIYPVGTPRFWSGNFIPEKLLVNGKPNKQFYFFIRFKCRFKIKQDKLPFIQIKNNILFNPTEMLKTSRSIGGYDNLIELSLTMWDFMLFNAQYEIRDLEILDGCYFEAIAGIFDDYIDTYIRMKAEATIEGNKVKRMISKLMLNNLYGRMASSKNSSFKLAALDENNTIVFDTIEDFTKQEGYIAIGSAITSFARLFTINAAQKNYAYFRYADTDSIHCECQPEQLKGIRIHDTDLCAWKIECKWDEALFVRQKTYIEKCEGSYEIKCAGLPEKSKALFNLSLMDEIPEEIYMRLNERERAFVDQKRTIHDFKRGLRIPSKLIPKQIEGGILLVDSYFTMR